MFDYEFILNNLKKFHQESSLVVKYNNEQVSEYIDVGEYGLAIDTISYGYVKNHTLMSAKLFDIFENLVKTMDLLDDPEYESVKYLMHRQNK